MAAAKDLGLTNKTQNGFVFWGLSKPPRRPGDPIVVLERAWERYHDNVEALVKEGVTDENRSKVAATIRKQACAGDREPARERLERLVGRWTCPVAEARTVELAYRVISSGSALVETFTTPSGKETLTIFHLDGSHLLATHYCGQGNQPQLRLQRSSDSTFDFRFQDATNRTSQDVSHLDRLELKLIDGDHYEKTETYVAGGKEETTRFLCERVR